jgi:hypothetical protein
LALIALLLGIVFSFYYHLEWRWQHFKGSYFHFWCTNIYRVQLNQKIQFT